MTEADATHNRNVVNVCLNRIDDCRPFFICFLGQRYGWVPERKDISPETFARFPGLEETVNKGASITELEILHSLVNPFHSWQTMEHKGYSPSRYSFFYFRDDAYLSALEKTPKYLKRICSDLEEDQRKRRKELYKKRAALIKKIQSLDRPLHAYSTHWDHTLTTPEIALPLQCPAVTEENKKSWRENWREYGGVRVAGLDVEENPGEAEKAAAFNRTVTRGRLTDFRVEEKKLGDSILEDLKKAISHRYPDHKEVPDPGELQREVDQQEQFVFVNSEGFIRRESDFDELDAYAASDSRRLFVLTAVAGMGKSTLLANWADGYREAVRGKPGNSVHFRFIGASDGSTTVFSLLRLLLMEMQPVSGIAGIKIPISSVRRQTVSDSFADFLSYRLLFT